MRRETDAEFDDGGTPGWRARHARVIDVSPPGGVLLSRARAWWRRTPTWKLALVAFVTVYFGPWVMLFGGIATMALLGINPG